MILRDLTTLNAVIQDNKAVLHTRDRTFAISRRITVLELSEPCGHLLQVEKGAVRQTADQKALMLSVKKHLH
jgi:hypothetical protein